jgi:hypothetical protein
MLADAKDAFLSPDAVFENCDVNIKNDDAYQMKAEMGDTKYTMIKEKNDDGVPILRVKVEKEGVEDPESFGLSLQKDQADINRLKNKITETFKQEMVDSCQKTDAYFAVMDTTRKDKEDGGYTIKTKVDDKSLMLTKEMASEEPKYSLTLMGSESQPIIVPLEDPEVAAKIANTFENEIPALQKTVKSSLECMFKGTAENLQDAALEIFPGGEFIKFKVGDKQAKFTRIYERSEQEPRLYLDVTSPDMPDRRIELTNQIDTFKEALTSNYYSVIEDLNGLGPGLDVAQTLDDLAFFSKTDQMKWHKTKDEKDGGFVKQEFIAVHKGTKYTINNNQEQLVFFGDGNQSYITIEKLGQKPTRVVIGGESEKEAYGRLMPFLGAAKDTMMEELLKGMLQPFTNSII